MTDHVASIRARRAQSNAAIAARDLDGVVSLMQPDVSVAVAGGPTLAGRAANRAAFAEQFADPSFRGYVRTPDTVTLSVPPTSATEMGHWVGHWQHGRAREAMRGTYLAQWTFTSLGWFIASEVFVGAPS